MSMLADFADGARPLVVDVALTPAELGGELRLRPTDVAIVIDVIRATTTLAVLFDRGCARVLVAGDIPAARAYAAAHPGSLLAGEMGGLPPSGFDFGNSPVELAAADLNGRELIFSTTNGTRALHACVGAGVILAGSLRNAQAVCRAALRLVMERAAEQPVQPVPPARDAQPGETASEARVGPEETAPRLVVVCSGRLGRPAVDDTLCAGVLLEHLEQLAPSAGVALTLLDGAHLARRVAAGTAARADLLRASAAGQAVVQRWPGG